MADHQQAQQQDHGEGEAGSQGGADDLSIPMWVWTLLGFTLVTAVVIIVIIWGGTKKGAASVPEEDPLMMEEAEQTMPAETQPAEPATAPAAQ